MLQLGIQMLQECLLVCCVKAFITSAVAVAAKCCPALARRPDPDTRYGQGPPDALGRQAGRPQGNADPCTYGAGYLDVPAALSCTDTVTNPALSPALSIDSQGNVGLVNDSHVIWGTNIIWGKHVWGKSGLYGTNIIWGKSIIWGKDAALFPSGTLSSSSIIWGKSVWSDSSVQTMSTSAVDLSSTAIGGE